MIRAEAKYKNVTVAVLIGALLVALRLLQHYLLADDLNFMAMRRLSSYSEQSILGPALLWLQSSMPLLNGVVYVAIVFLGGLIINKFTIQNNLFGVASKLPSVIYALMCVVYLDSPIILMPALAALMVSMSIPLLQRASTSRHHSSVLFWACLMLGVLPLIYPVLALLVPVWVAMMLIINNLTYRDMGVALVAIVAPLLLAISLRWLFVDGVAVSDEFLTFFASTVADATYPVEWIAFPALFVLLCSVVAFLGLRWIDDMSMRYSLRRVVKSTNIWLLLSLALLLTPAFSFELMAVVAAPVALLATTSLVYMRPRSVSYVMCVALFVPFVAGLVVAFLA